MIPRCDARARYGQCKQKGKYEYDGHHFCSHHYTILNKKGNVRVVTAKELVVREGVTDGLLS